MGTAENVILHLEADFWVPEYILYFTTGMTRDCIPRLRY